MIKSILHAIKFHDIFIKNIKNSSPSPPKDKGYKDEEYITTQNIRRAMQESHKWTNEKFGKFVAELDDKDWQSDVVFWSDKYV